MLARKAYYLLKPWVPWRARVGARRFFAVRKRKATQAIWPIDEAAAQTPANWPGWPEGKKCSFVITHDVEGASGLAKCRQLAEVEMELGFRSSFNFIPEGEYRVSAELRNWLTENGFEVGVHDLHHDGKLFDSEEGFRAKAKKINRYAAEWGAKGFRAGFMLRNLDWMHDLDVVYDASTFDTDPFEHQSDGARTIFPFWIPTPPQQDGSSHRGGYVELPYSLPQDSTLFLVLREKTPKIWLDKTDWVASHGGMVLVNVHPDYLCFPGEKPSAKTFDVEHYRQLLIHIRDQYGASCWHPLPHQLASWYPQATRLNAPVRAASETNFSAPEKPAPKPQAYPLLQGKRAAVLLYSVYPADVRVCRACEAMIEAGMQVDILCLREYPHEPLRENVGGVQVYRYPTTHKRGGALSYIWQYSRFIWVAFWFLLRRGFFRKYDIVHVHNMPDILVFSTVLARLRGAKVILDLHDPTPELMMTIFELNERSFTIRVLKVLEKLSIGLSHFVLTPNIAFKNLFVSRSCRADKIDIVMNSPQHEVFDPVRLNSGLKKRSSEFHIMHHGSIFHRHGVDLIVEAVARVRGQIPGLILDIYGGETPFLETVLNLAHERGVTDIVRYHGNKTIPQIAEAIVHCDLGVVPNRKSVFTEINLPTRILEYIAMNRPVIAPSTAGVRDYFTANDLVMFEPGNIDDLVEKILWVYQHPVETEVLVQKGRTVYEQSLWASEKARFLTGMSELLSPATRERGSMKPAIQQV